MAISITLNYFKVLLVLYLNRWMPWSLLCLHVMLTGENMEFSPQQSIDVISHGNELNTSHGFTFNHIIKKPIYNLNESYINLVNSYFT